jgi:hypothetical protein
MSAGILERVYKHRLLSYKCESGEGVSMDEVHELELLESELKGMSTGRGYQRFVYELGAMLRYGEVRDLVPVGDLGPGGVGLRGCPQVSPGSIVQIELTCPSTRDRYCFQARVVWLRLSVEGRQAGLRFVGRPLHMRQGPPGKAPPESLINKLRTAAA